MPTDFSIYYGMRPDEVKYILADKFDIIHIIPYSLPITDDFLLNRLRIFYDQSGKVVLIRNG